MKINFHYYKNRLAYQNYPNSAKPAHSKHSLSMH